MDAPARPARAGSRGGALMARMSRMDAAFLAMERPNQPGHLGTVMIFRPSDEGPLSYDTVLDDRRRTRLPLVPLGQRRVVAEVPFGLGRPSWAPDQPSISATTYATRRCPRRRGGRAGPRRRPHPRHPARPCPPAVGALGHRRARRRPGGAVLQGPRRRPRRHHRRRTDDGPARQRPGGPADGRRSGAGRRRPTAPDRSMSSAASSEPLPDQLRWAAGFPGRVAERAMRAAGEQWPGLRETAVEVTQRTPLLGAVANLLPTSDAGDVFDEHPTGRAPRLSFNAPITRHRRFALARLPIDDILAVKHAAGTTFNDVVIAVCAGDAAALAAGARRAADVADGRPRAGARGRVERSSATTPTSPGSSPRCPPTSPTRPSGSPAPTTRWRSPRSAMRPSRRR